MFYFWEFIFFLVNVQEDTRPSQKTGLPLMAAVEAIAWCSYRRPVVVATLGSVLIGS